MALLNRATVISSAVLLRIVVALVLTVLITKVPTLKGTADLVGTLAGIICPLQSTHTRGTPSMAGVMLSAEGSCSLHPMVFPMTVGR